MKTNRPLNLLHAAAAAALAVLVTGCYYMPGSAAGNAKVALGVKGLPANMTSAQLVVTAPGMAPITTNVSTSSSSITVSVPAGLARTFTLLLNNFSTTLQGVATVDLQPGQNTTINLTPTLAATQIVIPDYYNDQIVQISDMSGTGLTAINTSSFGATGLTLTPWAIDFDNLGRIYIANSSGGLGGLLRIDDINHPLSLVKVDSALSVAATSVAVDRTNGIVYYCNGATIIYKQNITSVPSNPGQITLPSSLLVGPSSMAADDQGILYMVITYPTSKIVKYNPALPAASAILATSTYSFTSAWGIMVKGPYVYVSDSGAGKIVRLTTNLQFVDSFPGPSTDPFYGPETFLATLNRKFTIIDEKSGAYDRLASFDDMTGAGWTTFGSSSTSPSTGIFNFYGFC